MVERPQGQDAEPGVGPDERRSRSADSAVAAADDQQGIAAFGDRLAAYRAIAAGDQLDVGIDFGFPEGVGNLAGDVGSAATAPPPRLRRTVTFT